MTETEIERLVVRLTGDATSYVKMLTDAQKQTAATAKQVEVAASRIEKYKKHLEGFSATTGQVLGATGITLGLKAMYDQFDKADDLITELSAVIKANGNEVDKVLPKYRDFAAEMARLTTNTKGQTLEMLKNAESLGLTGERAQKAIKTAITLGAIKGTDPTAFMRQAVNFEKTGNASGLARILGLMGEMEEDTTKAAEAAKLLEKNWALVLVKGEDGGARIERSLNTIKELGKDVGKVISDSFEPLIVHLESLAKLFQTLDPTLRKVIVSIVLMAAVIEPLFMAYGILTTRATAAALAIKSVGLAIVANPAAAAIVLALAAAYVVATREREKLNEAVREGNKLDAAVASNQKRQIGGMSQDQITRDMGMVEKQLKSAEEKLKGLDTSKRHVPVFGMGYQEDFEEQERLVKSLKDRFDALKDAQSALNQTSSAGTSKETLDNIRALNDEMTKQIDTMGMSETDARIYELRLKAVGDAAAQADLDVAEYNGRMLEAAKAQRSANDSAKDLIKSLEFQVATLGKTENEATLMKMAMEGVDQASIDRVKNLQTEIEVWEVMQIGLEDWGDAAEKAKNQYQALNAIVAGGADAAGLIYQYANQFGDDTKAVNKAATMRGADFTAKPDRNLIGPQLKGADAMKTTEKKLDDLKTVLEQIRDKDGGVFGEADLSA